MAIFGLQSFQLFKEGLGYGGSLYWCSYTKIPPLSVTVFTFLNICIPGMLRDPFLGHCSLEIWVWNVRLLVCASV